MKVWRICRAIHAEAAFTGEGARRFGGRWNSRGVPMVYASASLSLAALELFVHLDPSQAPGDLVSLCAALPEGEPGRVAGASDLPDRWWIGRAGDETASIRDIGNRWIEGQTSLAMMVPSAVIRQEWNVLLNPAHPRMSEVKIEPPEPFLFDQRMFWPEFRESEK